MIRIALVAAVARNGVIGARSRLPWRIADDLKWFKQTTMGKPVVMGRKTYESIGKPLPGRDTIVVTRASGFRPDGVQVAQSVKDAVAFAALSARARGGDEVCIVGGGEIYAQTLGLAERIYLTRVAAEVEGDARFPDLDPRDWRESAAGAAAKGPRNDYDCTFVILDRIRRG